MSKLLILSTKGDPVKAIISAIAIAIAILLTLVVTPMIIPTAAYEHLFVRALSHQLGGTVTVDKMRVRFLPYLSFTISGTTLSSQEPLFQGKPIAQVERISGAFSVFDILRHRLNTSITIEGLELNRLTTIAGTTNLDAVFATLASPMGDDPLVGWQIGIDSISISNGSFNTYNPQGQIKDRVLINEISINEFNTGPQLSGNAYMKAAVYDSTTPNMELSGRFFFERSSTTFHARGCKILIAGISGTLDASFELARKPLRFELHGATPSANHQQLSLLFPKISKGFAAGISWAGPVALDLYLKGSPDDLGVRLQAEASMSEVRLGSFLNKPTGRPLKVGFAGTDRPSHLKIDTLNIHLGENLIHISGSVFHQPDHQAQLKITSDGFKHSELITSIPLLELFERLDATSFSATVQGSLDQSLNRLVFGQLSSGMAMTMGVGLSNLEIDFRQEGSKVKLPLINAKIFDGKLSANGEVQVNEVPQYAIQAVIDKLDMEKLIRLNKLLSGRGSLVFKLSTQGRDSSTLAKNLSGSGTLVATRASAPALPVGTNLLGAETWKIIESELKDIRLEIKGFDSLAYIDPSVNNMHVSFSLADGIATVTDLRYLNPVYTFWLQGTVDDQASIDATGSIWINKGTMSNLVPVMSTRNEITNRAGELQIPFSLKGKEKSLALKLEDDELRRIIQGATTPAPTVTALEKQGPPPKVEPEQIVPKKKKAAPKRARPEKPPSRQLSPTEADDVMKVIIR